MKNESEARERLQRIAGMEAILEEAERLNAGLEAQLEALDGARGRLAGLFEYYGSDEWFDDRESDLPEGTKAGVLSEDLVYDQITTLRDSCYRMLELATDILKNVL